ncbi:primosomal replication protein N'' [Erwinia sp. CPCC 100877]|nr:primosomal replication protein N'' [Erwinia sp. CPCC 100877]
MNTPQLLQSLEARIVQLRVDLAPLAGHMSLMPRFDIKLFSCRGALLGDYLAELENNYRHLTQAVTRQDAARCAWLAERLVNQVAALTRESATWRLRRYDDARHTTGKLSARLHRHQDYERRLLAMKAEREALIACERTLAGQQRLARELEALEGRLERCRAALATIAGSAQRKLR